MHILINIHELSLHQAAHLCNLLPISPPLFKKSDAYVCALTRNILFIMCTSSFHAFACCTCCELRSACFHVILVEQLTELCPYITPRREPIRSCQQQTSQLSALRNYTHFNHSELLEHLLSQVVSKRCSHNAHQNIKEEHLNVAIILSRLTCLYSICQITGSGEEVTF